MIYTALAKIILHIKIVFVWPSLPRLYVLRIIVIIILMFIDAILIRNVIIIRKRTVVVRKISLNVNVS
jgi:hypothetical protein